MAGVNAKISGTGALTLSWYDMSPLNIEGLDGGTFSYPGTTSYLDGDTADGGSFNPWNTGYEFDDGSFTDTLGFHQLTQIKDVNISTDDIQITGVKVTYDETVKSYGTDVYMVEINDNPFVAGHENTIASYLYNKLKVLNFRPFTCSNLQDPTIESGDCALLWDAKGNSYKTIITNVSFSVNSFMNISCTAKAPTKQGSTYVNAAAQAVVQARRNTEKQIDEYSQVVNHFNELANNSLGYYKTVRTESGATITYIHDQPQLANSRIIWKITGTGIFISEDGGQSYTAGYDASTATMLVNLVYAVGINCDWIHSGTLTLGGNNNVNGVLSILNGSGAEVGKWNNAGIEIKSGSIKLTKTGWNDTTHNGVFIGSNGIQLGIDNVFQVTNTGALTASSATITGKVTATSGRIGGNDNAWNIGTQSIYNGCTGINNTNSGTYVGIDGIRNQNGSNYVKINSGTLTANNVDIDGGSITIQRNVSGQMVTYFSVSSNGSMNARAGYIGNGSSGWTIADSSIYNGCTGIDDNNHTGTYVGTNGIRNQGTNGARVRISGGGIQANSGNIGGFAITSNSLGNTIGTDNAVGMISQDQLYAWSSGKSTRIKFGLIQVATGSQSDTGVRVYNSSNESGDYIHYGHSDVYRTSDGRSVEWGGSDERLKEGIEDLTLQEAKEIVSLARPRKFRFKSTANERGTRYGFIAQELRESLNTLKEESGIEYYNKEQEPHYHNIHYMDFIAPLCVIIRDMQAQIDELKNN